MLSMLFIPLTTHMSQLTAHMVAFLDLVLYSLSQIPYGQSYPSIIMSLLYFSHCE